MKEKRLKPRKMELPQEDRKVSARMEPSRVRVHACPGAIAGRTR